MNAECVKHLQIKHLSQNATKLRYSRAEDISVVCEDVSEIRNGLKIELLRCWRWIPYSYSVENAIYRYHIVVVNCINAFIKNIQLNTIQPRYMFFYLDYYCNSSIKNIWLLPTDMA